MCKWCACDSYPYAIGSHRKTFHCLSFSHVNISGSNGSPFFSKSIVNEDMAFDSLADFSLRKWIYRLDRDSGAHRSPDNQIYYSGFCNFFKIYDEQLKFDPPSAFNLSKRMNSLNHEIGPTRIKKRKIKDCLKTTWKGGHFPWVHSTVHSFSQISQYPWWIKTWDLSPVTFLAFQIGWTVRIVKKAPTEV